MALRITSSHQWTQNTLLVICPASSRTLHASSCSRLRLQGLWEAASFSAYVELFVCKLKPRWISRHARGLRQWPSGQSWPSQSSYFSFPYEAVPFSLNFLSYSQRPHSYINAAFSPLWYEKFGTLLTRCDLCSSFSVSVAQKLLTSFELCLFNGIFLRKLLPSEWSPDETLLRIAHFHVWKKWFYCPVRLHNFTLFCLFL
jgi:hypothetical protein